MKFPLLSFVAAIVAPVALGQQPSPLPPLVTVSGSAEIRVVPDLADLYFEVEVRDADLALARKEQAGRATKVLAALRAAGIGEAELQTSQVLISPRFADGDEGVGKVKAFSVSQNICCTVHDVKKVPDLTAAAVTAGATGTRDVTLRTSKLRKYRDEARAKAVRFAKEKAVALASELGAKIGKPYRILEGIADEELRSRGSNANAGAQIPQTIGGETEDATSPTFTPGTISVSADVTVSFFLE
jgi:uncharacterized protein YggE